MRMKLRMQEIPTIQNIYVKGLMNTEIAYNNEIGPMGLYSHLPNGRGRPSLFHVNCFVLEYIYLVTQSLINIIS